MIHPQTKLHFILFFGLLLICLMTSSVAWAIDKERLVIDARS